MISPQSADPVNMTRSHEHHSYLRYNPRPTNREAFESLDEPEIRVAFWDRNLKRKAQAGLRTPKRAPAVRQPKVDLVNTRMAPQKCNTNRISQPM